MTKMTCKRNKLGFMLAELLLVIAILAILIALGVTGFVALRRNIIITKYDDLAREIYVAAQNQFIQLEANGMDNDTVSTIELAQAISDMPSDYNKDDWETVKAFYHSADQDDNTMEVLLPLGAVADDVRSGGFYVIEFNANTKRVYSVFYSENNFDYSTVSIEENFRSSKSVRKEHMVGYYGGSAVERDSLTHCDEPQLEILNENELRLNILNVPEGATVSVAVFDGTTEVSATGKVVDNNNNKTVLLDSMRDSEHFCDLFPELKPGKDLKITVTYSKEGAVSSSASVTANSLFATRESSGNGEDVVTLAWARHLQNLENSVSKLNDPDIATARQTEHIQWVEGLDFVSIKNSGANEKLKRFEGSRLEIRDLKGTNGLFAETKAGMQLSGIRIVNPVINVAGSAPVGALAGDAANGTEITMCGVYCSKITDGDRVDYAAYKSLNVDGGTAVTGGLVGQATNTTVTYSFAALPSVKGGSGAALIGAASGCTINNSYANCDDLQPSFNYFVSGGGSNTITRCYAVGNVAATTGGLFSSASDTVTECYYAVSHREFAENWSDNKDFSITQFFYKGQIGDWTPCTMTELQNAAEADGWAAGWANMIAPLSHPYREYLDGRAFPYPAIGELDHYGSWPDGNGMVNLKVIMSLLNNEEAGYAVFAGTVVVKDASGNILFESDKHIGVDGTFDGQDTIQVAPGTEVIIEIAAAGGYEYISTAIDGSASGDKKINYTVNKDTEAKVTFKQNAFKLTGMPAEDNKGSGISGARYDIDLTSPSKTLNINGTKQSEMVETGSTVTVRPTIPDAYSGGSVVWYTIGAKRTYLTRNGDGNYTFDMPAEDIEVHVMYTKETASFKIYFYVMGTDGKYPSSPTQTQNYHCGLGSQINKSMINTMAESSDLLVTINGEQVRYLESAIVTSKGGNKVFECELKDGVLTDGIPHITAKDESAYTVNIYIARRHYNVTLTADAHISGVRFGGDDEFVPSVTKTFYYGATVTAEAKAAPGYHFTYWDPQDTRFMMSGDEKYTFEMPSFDLNLKASAAMDHFLVTVNLLKDDESWLFSDPSRRENPIKLTLVSSKDGKKYPMQARTEDSISYAMQAVVPVIMDYGCGYYVEVEYASGTKTWIYTSPGPTDNQDNGKNDKLLLYVRDRAVKTDACFYSVTYHPKKENVIGSAPKGGAYPMYYHLRVDGNTGLLRDPDGAEFFLGWKDYDAEGTGSYNGGEFITVTRRTDMFAQWGKNDGNTVVYHPGKADGGELPVDNKIYQLNEYATIKGGSLTRKGYRFIGWSTKENAATVEFYVGAKRAMTGKLDLYPVWKQEEYTVKFYDAAGKPLTGNDFDFGVKHYGDKITAPSLIVNGKNIVGWALSRGGAVVCLPGEEYTVTGDTKLYACTAAEYVKVTYKDYAGNNTLHTEVIGKGTSFYLSYVPTIDGKVTPVTAWSTERNGKGELFICDESGRSEEAVAFARDTTLYAVTGKVYNYNKRLWFDTLYAAVRSNDTISGNTLIVYRDTVEQYNVWFNKSLYVIPHGNRTVKWKDGATVDSGDKHRLDDTTKEKGEFVGCMSVSNNGNAVTVCFGKSDVSGLSKDGGTLIFDANKQSRVMALGSKVTFHMYDGITLTNGCRLRNENLDENSDTAAGSTEARSYYGGGVYAGLQAVFYMHGGTISYCTAYKGGGVYLFANKNSSTPGSKMYMGDMVTPTAYSSTAIYYEKGSDGFYINVQERVTAQNYKKYFVTDGNPEICYNTSTRSFEGEWSNDDGGGGLLMLDLKDGDLVLYKGRIHNNVAHANGGGIVTDGGDTTKDDKTGNYAKLRIYEVDISHNTAEGCGGGIFQWQGIVYVYNSTIRQNHAKESGGGIYLHHYGSEHSTVEFHYGDISDNKADKNGGGVYVETSPVKMTITHGNLIRNSAGLNGGGVYVESSGAFELQGGTVANNTAQQNGGGAYSAGTITVSGGTLSGNRTENYGGGIYTVGTMTMTGGTVCNNSARYLGGGVMVGGKFSLSGGSLYGSTDTDYQNNRADEDNVNPGPNDIYLMGDNVITIPAGGIALSGERRAAVDCERDKSQRFPSTTLPHRFAVYDDKNNIEADDALYFTYHGTRSSTYYSPENDLTVEVRNNDGLYFVEKNASTVSKSKVIFNLNYPEGGTKVLVDQTVGTEIDLNNKLGTIKRDGYYLVGWARTPDAIEEDYVLFYDVVDDIWKKDYSKDSGWTVVGSTPYYTVEDLASQTLYAQWRHCVVVYDVGEAPDTIKTPTPTSVGPHVTILNPSPMQYTKDSKTYHFMGWKIKGSADDTILYSPMDQVDLTGNLRLEAVWKLKETSTYVITFYFNDGTSDQTGELRRDVLVSEGDNYAVIGISIYQADKILVGWSTNEDGTGTFYDAEKGVIEEIRKDMSLYAVWADAVTLTYDMNGVDGGNTVISVKKGEPVTISNIVPIRDGYTFVGWAETKDAADAKYQPGDTIDQLDQDTTLYAVWKEN